MIPIKGHQFGESELTQGTVWTWASDLNEDEDSLVPVPLTEEGLAAADSLLIRAIFVMKSGRSLNGLAIYHVGDDEVFAIELISGRERFTFNKYVPDISRDELVRLAIFLKEDVESLLPIQFSIVPKELAVENGQFSF